MSFSHAGTLLFDGGGLCLNFVQASVSSSGKVTRSLTTIN